MDAKNVEARNERLTLWFAQWRTPIRRWLVSRSSIPGRAVDDLAQEVFMRLMRYSDDVVVDNPQSYLFRIATNVANEWREFGRHRYPHEETWLEDLEIEEQGQPEKTLARAKMQEQIRAVVATLPAKQRETLILHITEGLTYKQIATKTGRTYRTVLRDLTRAYHTVRVGLGNDMDDLLSELRDQT